ncbi:MAG: hypothetical protein FVQ85_06185 [Planctomycetes bacterium]|nr:hypothetical protein [Planctomycetota bacterium]
MKPKYGFLNGKGRFIMLWLLCWLALAIVAPAQSGGQYDLSWSTIDGGGGRSSGGQYSLLSTIGQPDAAYSASGDYELLGGFLPGGPLCFVNFEHFARFAEYWREPGTGLPADLYEDIDNIVNWLDLGVFVEEWLCSCPAGWPLK